MNLHFGSRGRSLAPSPSISRTISGQSLIKENPIGLTLRCCPGDPEVFQKFQIPLLRYSSQLWVVLSNVYGELIVVLTLALCLAEVMDTPVPLLSLQVSNPNKCSDERAINQSLHRGFTRKRD